jgi:hypothetical protein
MSLATGVALSLGGSAVLAQAPDASPRALAPVDLTGQWVSVVTEDWAWRMRTPPKGDYASLPLNAEGTRVASTWTEDQDGSCLAFGAAALLRMPTRVRISWQDDYTLTLETDNGRQTRRLRFDGLDGAAPASGPGTPRTLQGESRAEWPIATTVTGSGADAGVVSSRLAEGRWAPLEVTTTNMSAAWLRPNGVPYSENAVLTEYFDRFTEGDDEWFTVTTIVEDPTYLTEPLVISSNFKREPDGSKWAPAPCKG